MKDVNFDVHSLTPRSISILPADRASQVLRDGSVRETVNTVLHLGLNYFGMEVATFSEVAKDSLIVYGRRSEEDEPPPSIVGPPGIAMAEPIAIHDIKSSRSPHVRRLAELGDGSYIGTPISSGGKTVAVLEFTSKKARAPFVYSDLEMAASLARWIESEIVQAARAERVVAAPSIPPLSLRPSAALLANVQSELRSPIASLLGLSTSISSLGQLNEEQRRALEAVHESGRHLLSLVDDIVELARLSSGQAKLELERVSLEDTCDRAIVSVRDQADRKHIRVLSAIDPRAEVVRADGMRLRQMVTTLLTNAVRLADLNGRVGLEVIVSPVTEEEGSLEPPREVVDIAVWDDGPRLEAADIDALFVPFDDADSAMSNAGAGIGVGLSIVQRLADLHGGSLTVERPFKGNRFTIRIPLGTSSTCPISETSTREAGTSMLVLVVDASGRTQSEIQPWLKARGHRVLSATSYVEAVDLAQMFHPDVVVMDVGSSDIAGLETLRQLREEGGLVAAPILTTTSLLKPGDRQRYLEAGATELSRRPVCMQHILRGLEQRLAGGPS